MANTSESGGDPLESSVTHLLHRASQIADEHVRVELERLKVTPRQYALMIAIDANPGATQTELVARTGIDKSTMAEMTRRLMVPKLIEKSLQGDDGRASSHRLTSSGRRLLKQCHSAAQAGEAVFLQRLPPARRKPLLNVLRAVVSGPKAKGRGRAEPENSEVPGKSGAEPGSKPVKIRAAKPDHQSVADAPKP